MKQMTFDGAVDVQWARVERRMEELMSWAKLRKRLAGSVRRQQKMARDIGRAVRG